jgi:hypothetical protein
MSIHGKAECVWVGDWLQYYNDKIKDDKDQKAKELAAAEAAAHRADVNMTASVEAVAKNDVNGESTQAEEADADRSTVLADSEKIVCSKNGCRKRTTVDCCHR